MAAPVESFAERAERVLDEERAFWPVGIRTAAELAAPLVRGLMELHDEFEGRVEHLAFIAEQGNFEAIERSRELHRVAHEVAMIVGQMAVNVVCTDRERVRGLAHELVMAVVDVGGETYRQVGPVIDGILYPPAPVVAGDVGFSMSDLPNNTTGATS
jgi:hypothetical protein